MKKIYISEDKVKNIIMSSPQINIHSVVNNDDNNKKKEPFTFYKFFNDVKKFISDLLKDPIYARPSKLLMSNGLDNDKLRITLQDEGVVIKKETIKEPRNEVSGKIESRYYVSYKVPKKDFKKKLRRMYQRMFEK